MKILSHLAGAIAYLQMGSGFHLISHSIPSSRSSNIAHQMNRLDDNNDFNTRSRFATNFDKIKSLEHRMSKIERTAPDILMGFYEPHLLSFSVRPGHAKRLSVTSTCFALQTISASSACFSSKINLDLQSVSANTKRNQPLQMSNKSAASLRSILEAVLAAEWRDDDLYQVPLILSTLLNIDSELEILGEELSEVMSIKVRRLLTALLAARPMRRLNDSQVLSDYIIYLCVQAMSKLHKGTAHESSTGTSKGDIGIGGLPKEATPPGAALDLVVGLARSAEISLNELCRQLAYRAAGDYSSFDVIRMTYSLLSYVKASEALAETAGREITPGKGPDPGTVVPRTNRRLVRAALAAFFAEQNNDGLWDKGQPIYKSFRKSGRNVGNAFVFAVDTLGSLMEALPAEDFRPHMDALQKTLLWIETHLTADIISDFCDPESGQCYGKPLQGWVSPHLNQDSGPQAWSTAQALTCNSRMRAVTQELMHNDVRTEFNGVPLSDDGPKLAAWDRLLDTDLGYRSKNCRTLKDVLRERILDPFHSNRMKGGMVGPGAAYSAILFGPPGTAKTTICESVAEFMGWDFVVIDTSAFLADGLTNVASRIRYVFERLQALENCVILFDEIEEFCLDRDTPGLGMESRMLTTAMLTAINDLRRAKKSIFFLATNRLRAFDSAITRPGRFDMQLFVGTPNLDSRCLQFSQFIGTMPLSEKFKENAEHKFRSFLETVWSEDAMFMNYLEGIQFASACADFAASNEEDALTNEVMKTILESQAAVMTVRGSARDEYTATMELSRF
mmetsp:Transcript_48500/g.56687  ORF Transcript_48500/g.56687 Transcript_48500/m.56687 type:complete len:789 (-) Transcript_48500:253-2619(-)